ncbi:shikimate kinase [Rhizobium calliandrae]|uniref:Shikimate kinase n=2 Tax=Rhizobium calliandrae TaxID=1312182 RepID=A0ABT7KPV4_9HYPH|nr:shikimate kinase [Rhizobium calliandrae]MDL2410617.1 shikimate kinase [Rhizobium calliandrae]
MQAVGQPSIPDTARSPVAREIVAALGVRPIVLVGMPGAGKSTIGRLFAKRLRLPFIDTDKKIEKETGRSISQIFELYGEEYFRALEARVIAGLFETGPVVIATGGGSFMHEQSRRLIGKKAVSIWLDTKLEVIEKRLRNDMSRPLLRGPNPEQKIARLFKEWKPFYEQAELIFAPVPQTR